MSDPENLQDVNLLRVPNLEILEECVVRQLAASLPTCLPLVTCLDAGPDWVSMTDLRPNVELCHLELPPLPS